MGPLLTLYAASGVEWRSEAIRRARKRLQAMGFEVVCDSSLKARHQRFAGSDELRLQTLYRIADAAPSVALASRGGYGMTRLLDALDWKRLADSVERGTRWVGYSDLTALQLGLLAHTGCTTWHGPMAAEDFGRELGQDAAGDEANEITVQCFSEAMSGELHAIGFRTPAPRDRQEGQEGLVGLDVKGMLWGGNLAMLCSLLGTRHMPRVKGGILFLEDVGEHPYRIERMMLQLLQAGILGAQKAVLVGEFSQWSKSPLDRGYTLQSVWAHLRTQLKTPLLTGLPFGHGALKLCLPVGRKVTLAVEGRTAFLGW